jgi:hypothetical protein
VSPTLRTTISWRELSPEKARECDVVQLLAGLRRLSALITLARVNILLAVDRFRHDADFTAQVQSYLAGNFLAGDVLVLLKQRFGSERLDVRPIFHSQQVLFLARCVAIHCPEDAGALTEEDAEARKILGKCLLLISDLLIPPKIAADLRNKAMPRLKQSTLLALSMASGLEVNNPPDLVSSLVRSDALFGDILNRTSSELNLTVTFKERMGLDIAEYLDFNIGVLVNYLTRHPRELMENADINFLNLRTFFAAATRGSVESFWRMELGQVAEYREELIADTKLAPYHNFTPFRKRPLFQTSDNTCVVLHPCFVQEKLEAGLFWAIFHAMRDDVEKDALFRLWGRLFETYVVDCLGIASAAAGAKFVAFPKYSDNNQEAFDSIVLDGKFCLVFECKGGFLKAEAKYSDDSETLMPDLDSKFGSSKTGALRQLASNITQSFCSKPKLRRELKELSLTETRIIVPILIVQERFVSSPMMSFVLADSFRSELRKQRLTREIDSVCQGLIVLDVDDVEALRACNANSDFRLSDCLFSRSLLGDAVLDFHDFLIGYAQRKGISLKQDTRMYKAFESIFNRVSQRFFGQSLPARNQD